ncbi:hypothetical protein [Vibrio agarivorans]|uniref:Uncharacterized protein n=1 Tax=Vibrio agarivorans TaxID=153622 RepID=A0ABT7Y7A4_9VIBR|nr:hypothetical protein [Vibrio agarivorans]MDN2483923.1 hypothetical protein [Vibrio agarivorans]
MPEVRFSKSELIDALTQVVNESSHTDVSRLAMQVFGVNVNPIHTTSNEVEFVGSVTIDEADRAKLLSPVKAESAEFYIAEIKRKLKSAK